MAAVSRRSLLRLGTASAGGSLLATLPFQQYASAAQQSAARSSNEQGDSQRRLVAAKRRSANGWEIEEGHDQGGMVITRPVVGSECHVPLRIGDPEVILMHIIGRFHYEIHPLAQGDVIGYKHAAVRRPGYRPVLADYESNHWSGTAVDILPGHYPPGISGGFFSYEEQILRDILAECEGVVRWGGDFARMGASPELLPDEGHFQIDVPPESPRVRRVARKIRIWNATPGAGAGVTVDTSRPERLKDAQDAKELTLP
jgi:hypothetical protein